MYLLMNYGVIVCPRCKQVKGIDLSNKTTKCIRCNKIITISKTKVFYECDKEELGFYVGLVNAEINDEDDKYLDLFKKNAKL